LSFVPFSAGHSPLRNTTVFVQVFSDYSTNDVSSIPRDPSFYMYFPTSLVFGFEFWVQQYPFLKPSWKFLSRILPLDLQPRFFRFVALPGSLSRVLPLGKKTLANSRFTFSPFSVLPPLFPSAACTPPPAPRSEIPFLAPRGIKPLNGPLP